MRSQIALFLIGLIAITSVASLNDDINFLQSLKGEDFGNTLVSAIQIELQSKGAVNAVLNYLRTLRKQLKSDSAADRTTHRAYVKKTQATLARLSRRIARLSAAISKDKNLVVANAAASKAARHQRRQQRKHLAAARRALKKNQETQATTTRVYRERFAQVSAYITALAGARQLLTKMNFAQIDSQSFVQLSNSLENIQFEHPKFQGFVSVLSELLSSVEKVHNQAQVNRIVKLVDQLYAQLVKEVENLTAVYKRVMTDLVFFQKRIQAQVNGHLASIARLTARLAQLKASTVAAKQRIAANTVRRAASQKQVADLSVALRNARVAYRARVVNRARQQAILKKVLRIFKTRFTQAVKDAVHAL